MNAQIISIGNEILIGQIQNTNTVWLAQQLSLMGITVSKMLAISDDILNIKSTLQSISTTTNLVIVTGGLGPTKDDVTKHAICEFLNCKFNRNEVVLKNIKKIYKQKNKTLSSLNETQADIPSKCSVIQNTLGTAPGLFFNKNKTLFFFFPGVPHEMKLMFETGAKKEIKNRFSIPNILYKTLLLHGISESDLSIKIQDWELSLKTDKLSLAYLPSFGQLRLRISGTDQNKQALKKRINNYYKKLIPYVDDYLIDASDNIVEDLNIEKVVQQLLIKNKLKLALVESCTGGYMSHRITSISGASQFYIGSIIPYSNNLKQQILNVPFADVIEVKGVVSSECVTIMVQHANQILNSDICVAISGIAGPKGGTNEKPVGTVWVAVGNKQYTTSQKFNFTSNRTQNITLATNNAFNMLRKFIIKYY